MLCRLLLPQLSEGPLPPPLFYRGVYFAPGATYIWWPYVQYAISARSLIRPWCLFVSRERLASIRNVTILVCGSSLWSRMSKLVKFAAPPATVSRYRPSLPPSVRLLPPLLQRNRFVETNPIVQVLTNLPVSVRAFNKRGIGGGSSNVFSRMNSFGRMNSGASTGAGGAGGGAGAGCAGGAGFNRRRIRGGSFNSGNTVAGRSPTIGMGRGVGGLGACLLGKYLRKVPVQTPPLRRAHSSLPVLGRKATSNTGFFRTVVSSTGLGVSTPNSFKLCARLGREVVMKFQHPRPIQQQSG